MGLLGMPINLMLMLMLLASATAQVASKWPIAKDGCNDRCGDVEIPYPFGMGNDCFLNKDFFINCDNSSDPPKPFLRRSAIQVTNISMAGQLHVISQISRDCYNERRSIPERTPWYNLSKFTISKTLNKFTVIGCGSYGYIRGQIDNQKYRTGCMSTCDNFTSVDNGACTGNGCCQVDIPKEPQQINFTAYSFDDHNDVAGFNPCTYAFLAEETQFKFKSSYLLYNSTKEFPMVIDWAITGNGKCEEGNSSSSYTCKETVECFAREEYKDGLGYLCWCKNGYEGNPYLSNGCQDIDECKNIHNCTHSCVNEEGSYKCECHKGFHGDGRRDGEGCISDTYLANGLNQFPVVKAALCVGIFFVALLVGISWLYLVLRKRKLIQLKEKFFEQNGGFVLQQKLSKQNGCSDTAKILTAEELKKATSNYAEDCIIGRGGYGTVYKGFLKDNSPVAIKKSKIVDRSQNDQFVNEVVVLSQINHRNVVRLLGCCLETEVPLLVYEFVNNGTLSEHIHDKDKAPSISWETRLRIAAETAGVLFYLHSAAATPIIHRDVKSTNILLDHNYTAKLSDFGTSKLVPIDETQLSTMVRGTLGYLDPEYLHTSQLTEKSDVYSFGVVLVELLTGKKALLFDRPEEERSLVMYFLSSLKEGCLFEILENHIVNDGNREQLKEVAELARMCLKVKGEERPTMREVAMELDGLRMMHKHSGDNAELNPEETDYLLCDTSDACRSGDGSSTTMQGLDSIIRDHVLVELDDGR